VGAVRTGWGHSPVTVDHEYKQETNRKDECILEAARHAATRHPETM
jgi:hypothetical protein